MKFGMNLETIVIIVVGSIIIGVLGGLATKSIWIGIGSPIVLVILSIMYLAIKPMAAEVEKKDDKEKDNTTQSTQE